MLRRLALATTVALACLAFQAPAAFAQNHQGEQGDHQGEDEGRHRARSVPEFDPLTVGGIAAVIVGGGVLIARRRKR